MSWGYTGGQCGSSVPLPPALPGPGFGIKGETEAHRWQILVLGPVEFRIAKAQKEKQLLDLVERVICVCPRYCQVCSEPTAHGRNANAQNETQTLREVLEILQVHP